MKTKKKSIVPTKNATITTALFVGIVFWHTITTGAYKYHSFIIIDFGSNVNIFYSILNFFRFIHSIIFIVLFGHLGSIFASSIFLQKNNKEAKIIER